MILVTLRRKSLYTCSRYDTDPSIHYTPADAWQLDGTENEYSSTTHASQTAGAQMTFQFRGTKVDVYGTISGFPETTQNLDIFTIDDGEPAVWSVPPRKQPVYNQKMFSSPILPDGIHILTMRVTVNNSDTYIDYLEFVPSPSQQMSSSLPLPSSSTTSSEAGGTSGLSSSPISPGAAAGIAVSVTVVVISLLGIMIWQYLKRRRRRMSSMSSLCKEPAITPFYSTPVHVMTVSPSMSGTMTDSTSEAVLKGSPPQAESRTALEAVPRGSPPPYQVEKRGNNPPSVRQSLA